MRQKDIIIGKHYRIKGIGGKPLKIGWAKVQGILQPKTGRNTTNKILAKCIWSDRKDTEFGYIKYFPVSLLCEEVCK